MLQISNLSEYKDLGTDGTKAVLSDTPAKWTITAVGDGTFTISTGGKLLQPYSPNLIKPMEKTLLQNLVLFGSVHLANGSDIKL